MASGGSSPQAQSSVIGSVHLHREATGPAPWPGHQEVVSIGATVGEEHPEQTCPEEIL